MFFYFFSRTLFYSWSKRIFFLVKSVFFPFFLGRKRVFFLFHASSFLFFKSQKCVFFLNLTFFWSKACFFSFFLNLTFFLVESVFFFLKSFFHKFPPQKCISSLLILGAAVVQQPFASIPKPLLNCEYVKLKDLSSLTYLHY